MGDQISEGGRSIHEIDKIRKRLEAEKMELEAALSEAEGALEQEENKVLRASLELTQVRQEIEMTSEAKMSEEKAQRSMIDAARLAEELRAEQDVAMMLERDKKLLDAQVKDAQSRLDDAEQTALKGGKKAIAKMETRIRELESELDAENRRLGDAQKNLRKS